MKKYILRTQTFNLLIILVFVTSCSGQVKTNSPKDSVSEPKAITSEQKKLVKTQGSNQYANVHCGLQDKAGNLWFGTTGEGVYHYNGKTFTNFTVKDGLNSNTVWCIYQDKSGNLWFGTADGVCRYDGKTFTHIVITATNVGYAQPFNSPINHPSAKNAVWTISQDKNEIIWFGTDKGVFRYNGKSFTNLLNTDNIINKSGLRLYVISSILEDKNGILWFASWNNEGVCRYDGTILTSFKPNGDDMVHSILEDKSGNLWFGTRDHGASFYDGKTFTNFTEKTGLSQSSIYSMAEDKAGNIWFATESGSGGKEDTTGGVWRYTPSASLMTGSKVFTTFTTKNGLSHNSVFSVTIDKSGKLWFGTREIGLCSYDGKTFTNFSE